MPRSDKMLADGIALVKAGKKAEGRSILTAVAQRDPVNEEAWVWLAAAGSTPRETISCLKRALAINPNNQKAAAGIEWATARLQQERTTNAAEPKREDSEPPASTREVVQSALAARSVPVGSAPTVQTRVESPVETTMRNARPRGSLFSSAVIFVLGLTLVLGVVVIAYLLNVWLG